MSLRRFLLIALLAWGAAPVAAANVGDTIRVAAAEFLEEWSADLLTRLGAGARIDWRIVGIDSRLTLPLCQQPLAVEARNRGQLSARLNLQVSCTSGNGWSIYVPVDVAVFQPVVIAARPLARGDTLQPGDLELVERDVTRLTGQYLTDLAEATGMSVRRPVGQGAAVVGEALEPPLLIKRGEGVVIQAADQAIAVRMAGTAMVDGRRGQQIRVRNSSSGKIVTARVLAPGLVEVML